MNIPQRIAPFVQLGELLKADYQQPGASALIQKSYLQNYWFTPAFTAQSLQAIAEHYLDADKLRAWLADYELAPVDVPQKIGVVMAGNIPAVGFHDALCVLISGHHLLAKLSTDDRTLLSFLLEKLVEIEPSLANRITLVERLNAADAYIATGSDNTSRYFEYYFAKKPHIIRRNRTSVGVLNGQETSTELAALGQDILQYFGLGCRNVSKVFVPEGYDFTPFYEAIEPLTDTYKHHHKYFNNYEYNRSVLLVNRETHLDNGFLIVRPSEGLVSPISVLFYETYASVSDLEEKMAAQADKIQCVVSSGGWFNGSLPLGCAQQPNLYDYADGVDTMQFLAIL
ncbi:MAG: acyl-CoA reductase [Runella slithyformis]|nr:MAG: acyl-CoA reductase [Runella slithyformis]TAF26133.1 MAG: acyl-CoA reductase [Runella slithyformis]TAF44827.1 MAG: acyl-CoA reductase [Runella slithyformis]TAF79051.1 MAG: acyl-CoA reductase [Runella slithyformis]